MKNFFKTLNRKDSHVLTAQLAQRFAEEAGPYSEELTTLVRNGDFATLANFDLDYNRFNCPSDVFGARSCLALFQKCDDYDFGIDREAVAYRKFLDCESSCKESNLRLNLLTNDEYLQVDLDRYVIETLERARTIIETIIGSSPPSIDHLPLAFGPGASSNVKKNTSARWKLSARPACSANMASTVCDVLAQMPHYNDLHNCEPEPRTLFERVFWEHGVKSRKEREFWTVEVAIEPGKLMFVPKSAKTDRSIIVEPTLNSFLQKGYGTVLKRLLFKANVNLYDQSINNARARKGSINDSLATIDLSSASDTICKGLVKQLLPLDWYIALNSARTSHVVYKKSSLPGGKVEFHLEKFSSMGNGFTFELESLIFYALTVAVCRMEGTRPDVTVFGDDIICPPGVVAKLTQVFEYVGFSLNKAKSYISGPFRESCGTDYFSGVNVRPFYNKVRWSSATLTAFHNCLVRSGWSLMYPDVLEQIIGAITPSHRLTGPDGFGDGHLVKDEYPCSRHKACRQWSGFTFETFVSIPLKVKGSVRADRIMPHYATYIRASKEGPFDKYTVRGHKGSKKISVYMLAR